MSNVIRTARTGLFGAAVAAALAFGATTVRAAPANAAPSCIDPAANGFCASQQECQDLCAFLGSDPSAAFCNTRKVCCYCDAN